MKGERCYSLKCPVSDAVTDRHSRAYPPGEHGRDRMRQGSEYLAQLREKQKARRIYGLLERQFRNLYAEASRQPGITGENLLRLLELRLDNVAFRATWGASRAQARQLVRHGHILVNGKRVTIPSYRVRQGDVVSLKPSARELYFVRRNLDTLDRPLPLWLEAGEGRSQVRVDRPARARAHRRARARVAHRRALLQVTTRSPLRAQPLSPHDTQEPVQMLIIQRPTVEAIGEEEGNRQRFAVSPLEPGFGHTLGNSIRRTLLSSIPGAAVTQVRFDDALHEFTVLPGVKEDVTDIILNLKDVVLRVHADDPVTLRCDKRGPADVTAADLQLTADVEVLNPELHIATLNGKGRLAIDVTVENGARLRVGRAQQAVEHHRRDPRRLDLLARSGGWPSPWSRSGWSSPPTSTASSSTSRPTGP